MAFQPGHRPASFRTGHCRPVRAITVCRAAPALAIEKQQQQNRLLFDLVEGLFRIRPLFNLAVRQAREKIRQRGEAIGIDLDAEVVALQGATDWDAELAAVRDPLVALPAYYTRPFHCYERGNLGWEAALQVNASAAAVHAPVMDPDSKRLDPDGDAKLRAAYSRVMRRLIAAAGARPVVDAVDLGCSTGLSALELSRNFPNANITGLDLSPTFLAVAAFLRRTQRTERPEWGNITLRHAAAEATGLPGNSADLVSCCLVMHELPQQATKAIIEEAYRILRAGGTFAVMEMDPASPSFRSIFRNPFAFAAFKSSEPWLLEYVSLDLRQLLQSCGFELVLQEPCTPRHFALVAVKKARVV